MRNPLTSETLEQFMTELGRAVRQPSRLYFTGGATALLHGWRETTIDLDIKIVSAVDDVLRVLPDLKERLRLNVELASPDDFIPEVPGWQSRSRFISRKGPVDYFHYDFYAQVLAKLERRHQRDLADVESMISAGLVEPGRLVELFESIEPQLYRFPSIDPASFRETVLEWSRRL